MKRTMEERFWSKVDKSGECWLWTGAINNRGYGTFFGPPKQLAHRIAWFLAHGAMPSDLVLHRCDNPPCVRPDHLFEGTALDNSRDCIAKGRWRKWPGGSVLTPDQVQAIRRSTLSHRRTAELHGVTKGAVQAILYGHSWRHLPSPEAM